MKLLFKCVEIPLMISFLLSYIYQNDTDPAVIPQMAATHCQLNETLIVQENPFSKFIGIWKMKEDLWEYSYEGQFIKTVDTSMLFIATSPTDRSVLWHYTIGSSKGAILWTFSDTTKEVYHLSENSGGPMAHGKGTINENGNLNLKLFFDGECATCYRMYQYKVISDDEIYFRSFNYKDDKETGDFYGGTFVRQK